MIVMNNDPLQGVFLTHETYRRMSKKVFFFVLHAVLNGCGKV